MSTIDNEIRELLKISCFKKKKLAVSQDYSHLYTDEYCQQLLEDIAAECRTLNIYKSNLDDCLKESKFLSAEDVYLNMLRSLLIADTGIQKHAIPRIWLPIVEEKLRCNEIDNNVKMSVKFTRDEYIDFIKKIRASLIMKNTRQMCRKIIVFFHDPFDIVTINIDPQSFDKTFMKALAEAREKADKHTQYKIIIPPGRYTIGHKYCIPGNIHIVATGATISATGSRTAVLTSHPDKRAENIILEGGTWSTLPQEPGKIIGAPFRFVGIKNMIMKDMTIQTNRKGHIIEVADMYGFTVEGCTISGNNRDKNEPYYNVQPKEAIQLDVATILAVPGFDTSDYMYNGKGCHKVLIKNNKIFNCARGVGSHSYEEGAEKYPYTNITITGNTFTNLIGEGIYGQNWRNTTITKNKINKCHQAGIFLCQDYNLRVSNNTVNDVRKYTGKRRQTYDPYGKYGTGILIRSTRKSYIENNKIMKTNGIVQEFSKENQIRRNQIKNIRK